MSKIEYDSLYKFIVSIGIALCTLSVLAIYFSLQESSVLLIHEDELAQLTDTARQAISAKQHLACMLAYSVLPFSIISFLIGVIIVVRGIVMWHSRQKVQDEKQDIELQAAKLELQKATPAEKNEKILREALESANTDISEKTDDQLDETLSISEIKVEQNAVRKENEMPFAQFSKQYRQVEAVVIAKIEHQLSYTHDIQTDVKIEGLVFDAVAVSKGNSPDYIFEIKYLHSATSWNASKWSSVFLRMCQQEFAYLRKTERKVVPVLVIVTLQDQVKRIQAMAERYLENSGLIVKVISENEAGIEST